MIEVALVDLGMGNLHSVERALARGAPPTRASRAPSGARDPTRTRCGAPTRSWCLGRGRSATAPPPSWAASATLCASRIAAGAPLPRASAWASRPSSTKATRPPARPGSASSRAAWRASPPATASRSPTWGGTASRSSASDGPLAAFEGEAPYLYFCAQLPRRPCRPGDHRRRHRPRPPPRHRRRAARRTSPRPSFTPRRARPRACACSPHSSGADALRHRPARRPG